MSAGVKDSTGTFTYPLCPVQGVITVLFCVGGTDSVCAELVPTSMAGYDGAERVGVSERMGDDDGEEGASECMGGEDRVEGVCESMGGDEGAERLCEHAFLCSTFFWLFLFDDDGEERVSECMMMTGQKDQFVKVWVVIRGQKAYVNVHFSTSHFCCSFSLPQPLLVQLQSLSVFQRNWVPILDIKKHTLILAKTK